MLKRPRNRIPVHRLDTHGAAPGTLKAPLDASSSHLSVMAYSGEGVVEEADVSLVRIDELRRQYSVVWVNLDGLADIELLQSLGEHFDLHKLALEDTLNISQRPKLDDYGVHQYFVARMPISAETLDTEQISVFLGEGYLLTVQERVGDCFDGIRLRIREGRGRIRTSGPDYLGYAVMDAIVDAYFPLLDTGAARLEELELMILAKPHQRHIAELHDLKQNLISLRRYLGPLRELISGLVREDSPYFTDQTRVYLRDCHDHAKQAYDLVESYRDIATGLMDLYLSMMSQRMNEVMKVLTIIATLFMPLSFIAGLYGMNFDPQASPWNMPELGWTFGYPAALGVMLAVAVAMLAFFWRKGWFR